MLIIFNKRVDILTGKRIYSRKYREFWANVPSEPFTAEVPFGHLSMRLKQFEKAGKTATVITNISGATQDWHPISISIK